MPWEIRQDGERYCVVKQDTDEQVKCHSTRMAAKEHMAALYANEKVKDMGLIGRLAEDFSKAINTLINSPGPESLEGGDDTGIFLSKEGGTYRWIARYSSNSLDDDRPKREIISSESHRKYATLVTEGIVAPPELWLFHNPKWKWGSAEWVSYDDSGFALAGGRVFPEFNELAEALMSKSDVMVSHGMLPWSVSYDPSDATVIVEHVTHEISPLPDWAAANRTTAFGIGHSKENDKMAISDEDRRRLTEKWGISGDLLDKLEAFNAKSAAQLDGAGVPRKEADTTAPEATDTQPVATDKSAAPAAEDGEQAQAVELVSQVSLEATAELSKAIQATMEAVIALSAQVKASNERLEAMSQADEARVAVKAATTPLASLQALMAKSVVGADGARVDGRTALAKSAPAEAKLPQGGSLVERTPFLNAMINGGRN